MINIDFECINNHKFEGCFSDYKAYNDMFTGGYVTCPVCETKEVKRIFSGCSIHARSNIDPVVKKNQQDFFEKMKEFNQFVKQNFEDTGDNFTDRVRAIHYGIEQEKNIYGKASLTDIKELIDEGIGILPVIDTEKISN